MNSKKRSVFRFNCGVEDDYVLVFYGENERTGVVIYDSGERKELFSLSLGFSYGAGPEKIKIYQVNDVVYCVHPDVFPFKIVREGSPGNYTFKLEEFEIEYLPLLDTEQDSKYLFSVFPVDEKIVRVASSFFKSSETWRAGGSFLLVNNRFQETYSGLLAFSDTHIETNRQFEDNERDFYEEVKNSSGGFGWESAWFPFQGKLTFTTYGVWDGTLVLEEKTEDGIISQLGKARSTNGNNNTAITREIKEAKRSVRIRCVSRGKAEGTQTTFKGEDMTLQYRDYIKESGCYWTLKLEYEDNVYIKVETIGNGFITGTTDYPVHNFSTNTYAEGAWNTKYGYPQNVGVFQERLVFAGNYLRPTTLWLSSTNKWDDFVKGTEKTSPITATALVDGRDKLLWMKVTKNNLIIGTALREWYFGNNSDDGIVSPSNYTFISISNFGGTEGVEGTIFAGNLVAAKAGGEELRAIDYNALTDETGGQNISLFSDHLFSNNPIVRIDSTIAPKSKLWALTKDGRLMSLTYDKDNEIFAWTQNTFLKGVEDFCVVRRGERDILVMLVRNNDDELILGELDPESEEVWTDDGERYESYLETIPLQIYDQDPYGRKVNVAGCDLYVPQGTDFEACLPGGKWHRMNAGIGTDGERFLPLGKQRVRMDAYAGWEDDAVVEVRTSYPAPLIVSAIGANFEVGG